jgi:hypothetical protein
MAARDNFRGVMFKQVALIFALQMRVGHSAKHICFLHSRLRQKLSSSLPLRLEIRHRLLAFR